ncbi:SnoaL-like protein [Serratia fonticola]|jgi:ketosteroid isomerase-like protein|uniref:SnoaL-like protein n=1 Tax=Serratia fonticola TaxID=47917 RepID=A0A542BM29_SERFO|nr:nuclear transport factor 2 family protein [Serratia fonticola]TQI79664.1 SnoaL-like protein [Serratia fonticola]TQI98310.1 SnoaL-like protein [Serratia fonticola]TVZ67838.1 SnoaL-like protein [Serratia fonticola]
MSSPEALLSRFSQLYASLDNAALSALPEVYHRDIRFIDPVGEHQGLISLQDYFRQLLTNLDYCRFTLTTPQQDEQQAVVCWQMTYAHPRLQRGQELTLEGISQLRFADRRIIYQRDYYDLGAMLYEHLPLVGQVVRGIKRRLRS